MISEATRMKKAAAVAMRRRGGITINSEEELEEDLGRKRERDVDNDDWEEEVDDPGLMVKVPGRVQGSREPART